MKLLIVDDEKLIAQGVAHVVRKLECDFDQVDVAYSGEEALQKLKEGPCDLLLTDVTMQGMSGLELIAEAKRLELCGEFCILSGYSEFEYARTAINLGVEEYLLKPVDKEKLREALQTFAGKARERTAAQRRALENSMGDALFGGFAGEDIRWADQGPRLVTVTEGLFRESAPFRRNFLTYYQSGMAEQIILVRHLPAFVLLSRPERKSILLEKLRQDFPAMCIGTALGGISDAASLRALYERALCAALAAHCFLDRPCLDAAELPLSGLSRLPEAVAALGAKPEERQILLFQVCRQSLSAGTPVREEPSSNPYVAQMLKIAAQHFREDLTLSDLSKTIGLNPDYAGRLFRSEEGVSFPEFLNRYRITRILECMLHDPELSFEQLAPCMGFSDMRSFYRVFKRIMQTTPGKYREAMLGGPPAP